MTKKPSVDSAFDGIREAVYERMAEMNQEDGLRLLALWDGLIASVSLMTAFAVPIKDEKKMGEVVDKLMEAAVAAVAEMKSLGVEVDPDDISAAMSRLD